MDTQNLQPIDSATGGPLLRSLRDVMARHGVLHLRAREGQRGHLELQQDGTAHPFALHLTWAQDDDRPRLRQAAALSADGPQEEEQDEAAFYGDLLMALLRAGAQRMEFGPQGVLAFVPDAREQDGIAFVGEGLVFTPRS